MQGPNTVTALHAYVMATVWKVAITKLARVGHPVDPWFWMSVESRSKSTLHIDIPEWEHVLCGGGPGAGNYGQLNDRDYDSKSSIFTDWLIWSWFRASLHKSKTSGLLMWLEKLSRQVRNPLFEFSIRTAHLITISTIRAQNVILRQLE